MKTKTFVSLIALLALLSTLNLQLLAAPLGMAFTYQGWLSEGGHPATGLYDLTFQLFTDAIGGTPVTGPRTNSPVGVTNGLFTTTLDFGPGVFAGDARWLEIAVRTNGAPVSFNVLAPRQALTAAPYALYAPGAGTAGTATTATTATTAASVGAGAVGSAGLQTGAVDSSKIADGSIVSSDLSATVLSNTFWRLGGNAGTTPGTHFVGTTDNQPLELKVNGLRVLQLEDNGDSASDAGTTPDGAPNVIGGSSRNFVAAGVVGATIGGGGATNYGGLSRTNAVLADFGVVGGGWANRIETNSLGSIIAGGGYNLISSYTTNATIGGGAGNRIAGGSASATIAGGDVNDIGIIARHSAIGGGNDNTIADFAEAATIGGGRRNDIGEGVIFGTIGGGFDNNIKTNSQYAVLAGGGENDIGAYSVYGTIGGGQDNNIGDSAEWATIGGGRRNDIGSVSDYGTIGGGYDNNIADNAEHATIPGGRAARADHYGQWAYASGQFASAGDAQSGHYVLRGTTSGTATSELFLDGSGARLTVRTNTTVTFQIQVAALSDGGVRGGYEFRGAIHRTAAGVTAFVSTLDTVMTKESAAGLNFLVEADNTNDALVLKGVGTAGVCRWVATVRTTEVRW